MALICLEENECPASLRPKLHATGLARLALAVLAFLAAVLTATPSAQAGPIFVLSNGYVTGIDGLEVDGTNYNIGFVTGKCSAVYGACITSAFPSNPDLFEAIYLAINASPYKEAPTDFLPCAQVTFVCLLFLPQVGNIGGVDYDVLEIFFDGLAGGPGAFHPPGDDRVETWITATAVPEPLTFSIFGAGLAGAVAMRRKAARKSGNPG
jgi:hypothetical protein